MNFQSTDNQLTTIKIYNNMEIFIIPRQRKVRNMYLYSYRGHATSKFKSLTDF